MDTTVLILTVILGFITCYLLFSKRRPKNFPPGPDGIPIFGNAIQLGKDSYKVALELREKYGDVIGFKMGSIWTVYLNDADDIREAFNRVEFTGKHLYNFFLDKAIGTSNSGIIVSEGRPWQDARRFCLRTFRDFGFGRKSMESIIFDEASQLIEEFKTTANKPISTEHAFNSAALNVLWCIVAGERYPHNDPRLEKPLKLLAEFMDSMFDSLRLMYFIFPALVTLRDTFPFLLPKTGDKFRENLFKFLRQTIEEHKNTLEEGNPRDFIDTYLEEVKKTQDPSSVFYAKENDNLELTVLLMDLFIGGSDTTSTQLEWSFFLLALHPEAQNKFRKEIQNLVGSRDVCLNDRPSLPYVEACIMEIMRVSTLTPAGAIHTTTQDLIFKGYHIPKNTAFLPNVYACHYRQDVWGDPENFRPERFLSTDGKTVLRNKNLIPFLIGKRACLGETLARDVLFVFLTNLFQHFTIEMPEGEPEHTMKGVLRGMLHPEPHQIVLRERN